MPARVELDRRPLDWNGPVDRPFAPFLDSGLDRSIIDHFESVTHRHRDRIAIREASTALTFGQLWVGLSGLAEILAAETAAGDLIGLLLPAGPMFPLAMLACLAAGRPFVALDPHYPGDWLAHVLKEARPNLLITGQQGPKAAETLETTKRVIHLVDVPRSAQAAWRPARFGVDEAACVLYTSGSTGRPKGIVNSQRNLLQRVAQSINAAHINAEDRFLTLASPCTIVGVRDVMTALLAGASVRLLNPQGVGAREILSAVREEAITVLFAFPALLRTIIAASRERAPPELRLVRVGGDTVLWGDIGSLRAWLAPGQLIQLIYAATEAPMLQWFVDDACRGDDVRIPIGYPLPGNDLAIIDEQGCGTPPGAIGELVVASPYVALGVWVDGRPPDESLAPCDALPFRTFPTGDLVRQRPDGLLERVGRKDRQVKIRGTRVDLEAVECVLREHAFVRDAAALARTGRADGAPTLVAYVSPRDEAPTNLIEQLREWMRSAPPSMYPTRIYSVPEIARLPSSKLDVPSLMALDDATIRRERDSLADQAQLAPRAGDGMAQTVARVWADVLRVPVGGQEDDFFDAGGDSLSAMTFTLELERALGRELSPALLNDAPRFGQLCEFLRHDCPPRQVTLVPLKTGSSLPSVFFIHGLGGNVVEILPTARRMTYPGPVIGIRARGLVRGEAPHSSVEAMAADYLGEIKTQQPNGPYYLCGYSFGGLVAFEIARRLSETGNEVGFVGLFDTMMSPLRWPLRTWLAVAGRRIVRLAAGWRLDRPASASLPISLRSTPTRVITVMTRALIASARYRPGFYHGRVTLFTPASREPSLPSLESIWRKHARIISIVETAGDHSTMLSVPYATSTAARLTGCLPV